MFLWGPKSEVPTHFVLKAQSPGRGALLLRARNESSLKVQRCGRERLYARHLTKKPEEKDKFSTRAAQGRRLPTP